MIETIVYVIIATVLGFVLGRYVGVGETEARYNRRWGAEIAARECTQPRHDWSAGRNPVRVRG